MADSPTIRLDNLRLKVKVTNYLANSRTTARKGYFSTHLVTKGYNLQRCNKITQYVTKRYRNNTNLRFRSASLDANQRSTTPASVLHEICIKARASPVKWLWSTANFNPNGFKHQAHIPFCSVFIWATMLAVMPNFWCLWREVLHRMQIRWVLSLCALFNPQHGHNLLLCFPLCLMGRSQGLPFFVGFPHSVIVYSLTRVTVFVKPKVSLLDG